MWPYCETPKTALQGDRTDSRPRVTTSVQDRYIRTSHLQDRYRMATTTARVTPGTHNPSISAQTVRNRPREAGLRACRPVVRQVLTKHHRQQHCLWAQIHHRWTRQDWQKVLFTDRSRFVSPGVMVGFAFIVEGMSVTPRPVLWSGIDLEVEDPSWSGAVCHSIIGLTLLSLQAISTLCVTGKIPLPHVVPFLQAHPDMILQHDNATSHTACSVRDFLQDRNVSVLPWPAKSLDLKPIEHVWDLLDWRVRAWAIPPRNVRELAGAFVEEWGNISQQELANLVQSMRRRCTAVLNAAGGHTRYCLLLLILTPPSSVHRHIIQFLLVTCLWNLFSLCLSC
uniref:Tc1-like transposase DDE domain-containing protein n=1 Tax=Hucho hucho TaxID=62062 RepID=A0A4W5JIM5_9TELE